MRRHALQLASGLERPSNWTPIWTLTVIGNLVAQMGNLEPVLAANRSPEPVSRLALTLASSVFAPWERSLR
jgi:hypothetical protein